MILPEKNNRQCFKQLANRLELKQNSSHTLCSVAETTGRHNALKELSVNSREYRSVRSRLAPRKATPGAEYVDNNLAATDAFTRSFQEAMTDGAGASVERIIRLM